MEYILNETPLKTTNSFKINNIKMDFNYKKTNFNKYEINNLDSYKEEIIDSFNSKIGYSDEKCYRLIIDIMESISEPIIINYNFTKDNNYLTSEIIINLFENTSSNIFITFSSKINSFNNVKIVTNSKDNSKSNISVINLLNDESTSLVSFENNLEDNSDIIHNFIDIGGKNKISNYYSNLNGNYSANYFNNIYIGKNNDLIDMNYYMSFRGVNNKGNIISEGALNDYSNKSFKGTIDFLEGSKKSDGNELENCLLLSENAKSKSLPMLLCHEEDVIGNHGISVGKIDSEKLFYLETRGLSEEDSIKAIIKSNFNKVLDNIKCKKIKDEILEIIDKIII